MRLALLSNVTVDLLAEMLRKNHQVYIPAGFDTWQQEVLMHTSGLYEFKPETVVLLLHADAYTSTWDNREQGESTIEEWIDAVKTVCTNLPNVPIFVSSIDITNDRCSYGAQIRINRYCEDYLVKKIETLHKQGNKVYVLPVADSISNLGRNTFYSAKMWYMGSMPYSMKGLSALNKLIGDYIGVIKGKHKKCLAVDLDNTLWGGVIGEDGVAGIVLSNNKEGARYKDTQRLLKKMKDQGVMLAILSKNNVDDVEPVYTHPDMILRHEDFVAEVINWDSKSSNIRKLASDLNIGLDAFVFLDDNPSEREQMKAECPEVSVIDFPKDSSLLPEVVSDAYNEYFLTLDITNEDVEKTDMYRAESKRKEERATSSSLEDYLKKLEMVMDVHRMREDEKSRVTQLTNKTNQFNVTTKRYTEEQVDELAKTGDIFTVHISDKYGDQGLVAVLIIDYSNELAHIDTFLMSCRVMGRKVEDELMAIMKKYFQSKGISIITSEYIRTAKNAPVEKLFDNLGFACTGGTSDSVGDTKTYRTLVDSLPENTGVFSIVSENMQ